MRERPKEIEPSQFLSGWKEIANYLGKGVRTVQRYERHMGLPVRRPAGKDSGSVVATRKELDAWVKASPIREEFRLAARKPPLEKYEVVAQDIRRGLDQMSSLRNQLYALRADLRESIHVLQDGLHTLRGEAHPSRGHESKRAKDNFLKEDEFDLLTFPVDGKAS